MGCSKMDTIQLVVFKERIEEYAIPVDNVISIEKPSKITPIPHLPNFVKGITVVRNELIPVVDLHQVLYGAALEITPAVRLLVIRTDLLNVALLIEDAQELIEVSREKIKQVDLFSHKKTSYFDGVIMLEDRIITVIDPETLIKGLDGMKEIVEYIEKKKNVIH